MILAEQSDAVILARGADARVSEIEDLDPSRCFSAWDVLQGVKEVGQVVLVIDEEYGHQGPTVADFLVERGKEVDIITS